MQETWTYGYDQRNQLTSVEKRATDGGTLQLKDEFKYDAFGNRIEKKIDSDGDSDWDTTQRYALDGWKNVNTHLVGNENWDVWADLDGSSSLTTRYVRGDVIDQLFARIEEDAGGDIPYWYLTDHLGSIRDVIDGSAVVKNSITYDGFGNITAETDSNYRGRYAWTGREFDGETELQYNRARYFDANTGRWISQDPLSFSSGDSNLYRYTRHRPTTTRDPSGLINIPNQDVTAQYVAWLLAQAKLGKPFVAPPQAKLGTPVPADVSNPNPTLNNPIPLGTHLGVTTSMQVIPGAFLFPAGIIVQNQTSQPGPLANYLGFEQNTTTTTTINQGVITQNFFSSYHKPDMKEKPVVAIAGNASVNNQQHVTANATAAIDLSQVNLGYYSPPVQVGFGVSTNQQGLSLAGGAQGPLGQTSAAIVYPPKGPPTGSIGHSTPKIPLGAQASPSTVSASGGITTQQGQVVPFWNVTLTTPGIWNLPLTQLTIGSVNSGSIPGSLGANGIPISSQGGIGVWLGFPLGGTSR